MLPRKLADRVGLTVALVSMAVAIVLGHPQGLVNQSVSAIADGDREHL